MDWIRAHPYATTLGIVAVLAIAGTIIVMENGPVSPLTSSLQAWGGGTGNNNAVADANAVTNAMPQLTAPVQPNTGGNSVTIPQLAVQPTSTVIAPTSGNSSFDFNAFLKELTGSLQGNTGGTSASANANTDAQIQQAYSFIPTGLVSTTSLSRINYTGTKLAIYQYGNNAGSFIQTYEQEYPNDTNVMQNFVEDRQNASKIQAVEQLGAAISSVGKHMQSIQSVPPSMVALNNALAQSYITCGEKLAALPTYQRDSDLAAAVLDYDAAVDTFIKNYSALALSFSANGVTFGQNDAGSVFSFTQATL